MNNKLNPINEEIIYNPIKEEEIKPHFSNKNNNQMIVNSNYSNIIPEVGVRIKVNDQSKNGGLNFKNQFGRMSMKEYEILREQYMGKGNEKNHPINSLSNQDIKYKNDNSNLNDININQQIKKNVNGKNDKVLSNFNNIEDNSVNLNNIPKTGKIMNENLFKHRTSKDIKTEKQNKNNLVNNTNNQIISTQNWGNSVNNTQKTNVNLTNKRIGETNLRTRKK